MDEKAMARIFKALGDENRVKIVNLLWNGEVCACRLLSELSISQPTLSHHMKILCDSGIVEGRKVGTWMYYKISKEGIAVMQNYLGYLAQASEECLEKTPCC